MEPRQTTHVAPTSDDNYCSLCGLDKEYWPKIPSCPYDTQEPEPVTPFDDKPMVDAVVTAIVDALSEEESGPWCLKCKCKLSRVQQFGSDNKATGEYFRCPKCGFSAIPDGLTLNHYRHPVFTDCMPYLRRYTTSVKIHLINAILRLRPQGVYGEAYKALNEWQVKMASLFNKNYLDGKDSPVPCTQYEGAEVSTAK